MEKSIKKQRRKVVLIIACVFLCITLVICAAFTAVIYNDESSNAAQDVTDYFSTTANSASYTLTSDIINTYYLEYSLVALDNELKQSYSFSLDKTYFKIKKTDVGIIASTGNKIDVDFYDAEKTLHIGLIDFDTLYSSMSEEQYRKITEYLTSEPKQSDDKIKNRYELVCTEFYDQNVNDNNVKKDIYIVPSKLEIVITNDNNQWYAQDEKVEEFALNPEIPENARLFKLSEDRRNTINTDFALGKCDVSDLIQTTKKAVYLMPQSETAEIVQTGAFTYVYVISRYYGFQTNSGSYNNYNFTCSAEVNVLERCLDTLIVGNLIIVLFFLIIGFAMGFSIWRTIKGQLELDKRRNDMTNAIVHDLKTPLFVISGFTENLKETQDNEKREHYIEAIQEQSRVMDDLVYKMLELSKLESADFKIKKSKLELDELISEMLKAYEDMGVSVTLLSDGNAEISADKSVMKLALENLIDNAIKYSSDGKIKIEIKNKVCNVTNCCAGIAQDELKKIWEPYYRAGSNSASASGNGLGLSIVRTALRLHKLKYGVKYSDGAISFWFAF